MNSTTTILPNGLRILTRNMPHLKTVSLGAWVKTGSRCESEDINGISHFLEHMAFKGTENRNAFEISEEIEFVGGIPNAYTSREFTAYFAKVLKDNVEIGVDIIADIIQNSVFPEEELIKERDVVIQEIKSSIDTPDDIVFDHLQSVAYGNQPIGMTILGDEKNINSFNRDTLINYIKDGYSAKNMVVSAAGNINHDEFVNLVKKYFTNLSDHNITAPQKSVYTGGFKSETRDIKQAHILFGFNGLSYRDDDYYSSLVFSTILGSGMSSRLFQEVREKKGLVYSIYSFANSYADNGLFGIYGGTGEKEVTELIPTICDEINKIASEKVNDKELERAKNQMKASIAMSLENPSSICELMARQMLAFGRSLTVSDIIETIENTDKDKILDIAQRTFSSKLSYSAVGAIKDIEAYEKVQARIKF